LTSRKMAVFLCRAAMEMTNMVSGTHSAGKRAWNPAVFRRFEGCNGGVAAAPCRKSLATSKPNAIEAPHRASAGGESLKRLRPFPVFIDERLFEENESAHRHRLPPIWDWAGTLDT